LKQELVCNAVVQHLESNCLIRASQHGFSKGYLCLTNSLTFLQILTGLVEAGGIELPTQRGMVRVM